MQRAGTMCALHPNITYRILHFIQWERMICPHPWLEMKDVKLTDVSTQWMLLWLCQNSFPSKAPEIYHCFSFTWLGGEGVSLAKDATLSFFQWYFLTVESAHFRMHTEKLQIARYSIKKGNASKINTLHFSYSETNLYSSPVHFPLQPSLLPFFFQNPSYYH